MAPELYCAEGWRRASTASDVFALGATLFCLAVGAPPWMGANQLDLAGNLSRFEFVVPSEGGTGEPLSPHLVHLLTRLLDKDPADRATLAAVIAHDWVTLEGSEDLFAAPTQPAEHGAGVI